MKTQEIVDECRQKWYKKSEAYGKTDHEAKEYRRDAQWKRQEVQF